MAGKIITIDKVVPWGRSFSEYVRMFALTPQDLEGRILSCADGPAAFNAHQARLGNAVTSADPIYEFTGDEIASRIGEAKELIVANTLTNMDAYYWNEHSSLDALVELRLASMAEFLEDYDQGKREGRYLSHALPDLPFGEREFDLAICSHFLFTYTRHFDTEFHLTAVLEMARVAGEARVFPLLDMDGGPSHHLEAVLEGLRAQGFHAELKNVPYEFQKGGNRMLVARN